MADEAAALVASTGVDRDKLAASTHVAREVLAAERKNSINLLWERTQAIIAISTLWAFIAIVVLVVARDKDPGLKQPLIIALVGLVNLVAGFYFGRTNHSRPTPSNPAGNA